MWMFLFNEANPVATVDIENYKPKSYFDIPKSCAKFPEGERTFKWRSVIMGRDNEWTWAGCSVYSFF
jgi:hypothetical protein